MRHVAALLAAAALPALAGVIGGTHDHMGPGHGPVVDHAHMPAPADGASEPRVRPTGTAITKQSRGSFRTTCGPSHFAHDDPIVWLGKPGATHLHVFFGNTGTDANSTAESLATTGNSTCRGGTANRTAYWVPAMIDTRDGSPVVPYDIGVYYKGGGPGVVPASIAYLPAGLRMIAGSAKASSPQSGAVVRWQCKSHGTVRILDTMHGPSIPQCPAGSMVMQEVFFPQCWDGVNLDSQDHKSHMAYPGYYTGCPASHPVALPQITFNVHYVAGDWVPYGRLSSDMYPEDQPAGYSSHGDWWGAWDEDVMRAWVDGCARAAFDCHADLLGDGRALY
jgi:hypothetical protein